MGLIWVYTITPLPPSKSLYCQRTMTSSVRGQITCFRIASETKMASGGVVQLFVAVILACLFEQVAAAFDGGDAAALIIGLIIGIMGICACLGAYARRQQGV